MLCDLPLHYNLIHSCKNKTLFAKYINLVAKLLFNLSFKLYNKLYGSVRFCKKLEDTYEYKIISSDVLTMAIHSISQNSGQSNSSEMDHTKESKLPHLLQHWGDLHLCELEKVRINHSTPSSNNMEISFCQM